jgi:hypothetical protein
MVLPGKKLKKLAKVSATLCLKKLTKVSATLCLKKLAKVNPRIRVLKFANFSQSRKGGVHE